jgi:hypothetical protein
MQLVPKVANFSEEERKNIIGQARFLRAHYYFDLKKMFNNVPYIDESTTDFNQPNTADIWPKITADLSMLTKPCPVPRTRRAGQINGQRELI